MLAICEQPVPKLQRLVQYLNTGATTWTKLVDAHNLPEIDIIEIDGATIYSWYLEDEIVGSMCVKCLGPNLCEIVGDIENVDQFVDTIDKLIKDIEM